MTMDFSSSSAVKNGKESICQCRRHEFDPLGQEHPLEKEMATCSSILVWENSMDKGEEPGGR